MHMRAPSAGARAQAAQLGIQRRFNAALHRPDDRSRSPTSAESRRPSSRLGPCKPGLSWPHLRRDLAHTCAGTPRPPLAQDSPWALLRRCSRRLWCAQPCVAPWPHACACASVSLSVSECACMRVVVCACAWLCVRARARACARGCVWLCVHACTYTRARVNVFSCVFVCVRIFARACLSVCLRVPAHLCLRAHLCAWMRVPVPGGEAGWLLHTARCHADLSVPGSPRTSRLWHAARRRATWRCLLHATCVLLVRRFVLPVLHDTCLLRD